MARRSLVSLAVASALALVVLPSGEAKFRMTLTMEPSRPVAGSTARVTVRTDVPLARKHGIRLHAVGPWRNDFGQALVLIPLRGIGSRTLEGAVRFPYPGRWHLDIPASRASPPLDRWVRVKPRP